VLKANPELFDKPIFEIASFSASLSLRPLSHPCSISYTSSKFLRFKVSQDITPPNLCIQSDEVKRCPRLRKETSWTRTTK
jgi:hypothetical protein